FDPPETRPGNLVGAIQRLLNGTDNLLRQFSKDAQFVLNASLDLLQTLLKMVGAEFGWSRLQGLHLPLPELRLILGLGPLMPVLPGLGCSFRRGEEQFHAQSHHSS